MINFFPLFPLLFPFNNSYIYNTHYFLKKTIPFILLCALFFNFTGYLFFFHINQFLIKKEFCEAAKNEDAIERISVPSAEYAHAIGESEIFIAGKLYDVIKYELSDLDIIFYCIHDEEEQSLLGFISELLEGEDNESNEDISFSFLNIFIIINDSDNLIKSSIYLAPIRDIAPAINSQTITPGTQPPKKVLFV